MNQPAIQKEKTVAYGIAKSTIKINPAHKGMLHRDLGVPEGQKIPDASLQAAKNSSDPAERKRATFAMNARKWNK